MAKVIAFWKDLQLGDEITDGFIQVNLHVDGPSIQKPATGASAKISPHGTGSMWEISIDTSFIRSSGEAWRVFEKRVLTFMTTLRSKSTYDPATLGDFSGPLVIVEDDVTYHKSVSGTTIVAGSGDDTVTLTGAPSNWLAVGDYVYLLRSESSEGDLAYDLVQVLSWDVAGIFTCDIDSGLTGWTDAYKVWFAYEPAYLTQAPRIGVQQATSQAKTNLAMNFVSIQDPYYRSE